MLIVLSPAKKLDFESPLPTKKFSIPDRVPDSEELIETLAARTPDDISALMNLSPALADLNVERFRTWEPTFVPGVARPALLAFAGDTYQGFAADRFGERDFTHAQKSLRILSGLHGILRPLDLIHPYRLEMGTDLPTARGKNLYEFWGDQVTDALNADLADHRSKVVVNLASNEYFSVIRPKRLDARVVTPTFLDEKNGEFKTISFFAKRARGAMAAWSILHRVKSVRALRGFDDLGYRFDESRSSADRPVFVRGSEPT